LPDISLAFPQNGQYPTNPVCKLEGKEEHKEEPIDESKLIFTEFPKQIKKLNEITVSLSPYEEAKQITFMGKRANLKVLKNIQHYKTFFKL
jgi:hypothetical protein